MEIRVHGQWLSTSLAVDTLHAKDPMIRPHSILMTFTM